MTSDAPNPSRSETTSSGILAPPTSFWKKLRFLGPSLIITGSIVGSGELIVTTTLGAQMGFVALWLIILSCGLKVIIQEEIGRYAIVTGETTLEAANRVPGPRWKVSWVVWGWILMTALTTVQVGGIIGGVGQALNLLFPGVGVVAWGILMSFLTVTLLLSGRYGIVERSTAIFVGGFTVSTVVSAILIQGSPHAISLKEVLSGLQFGLPEQGLVVAFAVFGITGIGTAELFFYPNWCLEKGYGRYAGTHVSGEDRNESWVARARGWIGVMRLDAVAAMILYTTATIAFYLLGAGVLHRLGVVPKSSDMILTLSRMFTETVGPGALYFFLVGGFFVLYSSLFVAVASNALMVVDCLGVFGVTNFRDKKARAPWIRIFVIIFASAYVLAFLLSARPVAMVMIGGIAQTFMLPVIAFAVIYLRYRHLDRRLYPERWVDVLLWTCSSLIVIISGYTLIRIIPDLWKQVFG